MPLKLSDRVRENTTTVGSGILSLVGNTDGFRRFDNVLASGDITYYCIEENDKFEIGIGTYQNNSISRDYILQSTQSGSKINLGGSGVVFLTYPADKAVYKNQESEVVVGPSGIRFFDNTVQKTATISSSSQDLIYISGVANYSSGQAVSNEFDIISVSGWAKNYVDSQEYSSTAVSGWADVTFLKQSSNPFTYISGIAVYASGNSSSGGIDIYTSGIATYASGQSILNSKDIIYLSGIATYASGNVGSGGGSGIDLYTSGIATYGSGQSNKNTSDIVYLSGLVVNAEETLDINYLSGIAIYSSGNSLTNQSAIEDIVNDLTYISGLVVSAEESNDIGYISGIAVYVSGNALYNLIEDTSPQLGGNLNTGMFNVSGVGNIISNTGLFTSLKVNNTDVSLNGHTHVANDITNFNTTVSGLIPVKNIFGGNNISVSSINGEYTISASGLVAGSSESIVTTVFNKTGSAMPKMTAVYINGGQGDLPTVQKAIATSDRTSATTYGITYEAIENMATGRVIIIGALTNLDTDQFNPNSPHGNINGVTLYLSPTTSGALTTTKPYAPNHLVTLGTIVRTHKNEGVIEVRIQNGFELEELHDVAITGVTNGAFLQYNSLSGLWLASNSGYFSNLHLGSNGLQFNDGTNQTTSGLPYDSGNLINKNKSDIIYLSGLVVQAEESNDISYVSGIAVYSSGQSIQNQQQILATSGWAVSNFSTINDLNYVSGLAVLAEESIDISYISGIATYTSGKIYNDAYISGIAVYASGKSILNGFEINSVSGWADSSFLRETSNPFIYLSGLAVSSEESNDIVYISGIATYASGQSIDNKQEILSVSGWTKSYIDSQDHTGIATSGWALSTFATINSVNYISGVANYASGQAVANQSNINTLNTNLVYISGLAVLAEETLDINYVSGIAVYGSGQSYNNQNQIIAVSGWTNSTFLKDTSPPFVYLSGLVVSAEESNDIAYISGISIYSSGLSTQNKIDIIAVSGLISGSNVSISNPADNRLLTSTGSSTGINAESNLTFDGTTLNVTGNVGIGTTSPDSKLTVYQSTGTSQIRFGASSNYYWDISRDNDVTGSLLISNYNATGSRTTRLTIAAGGDATFSSYVTASNALRLGEIYGDMGLYIPSTYDIRFDLGWDGNWHFSRGSTVRFNIEHTGSTWIKSTRAWNDAVPTLSIGNDGDGRLQTRHVWGKNAGSTAAEHLFLQHGNTSQHVQIGATGGGNNLYVVGDIYANGYFTGNLVLNASNYSSYALPLSGGTISGNLTVTGSVYTSTSNGTGGGVRIGDDGDIVDLNDAYCSMRFSSGVRIFSANKSGSPVITLGSNGTVTATNFSTPSADAGLTQPTRIYGSTDNVIRYNSLATFKAHMGLTGKNTSSRATITADSNYWTGSMGWGYADFNAMLDWGSGFTDVWDNPINGPFAGGHFQGIQALHYANGSARYGWQMACNAGQTENLYMRGVWGGSPTAWRKIVVGDSRNHRGATRLYRRDEDTDYSVQTYWTGARWRLYGYVGDTGHADTHVGYADATAQTNFSNLTINSSQVLHAGNYNSYSPTLTGGNASGQWNINAYPRRSDGANISFFWAGQNGQPAWLWGSNDGINMYIWNPAQFSVSYANTAGTAGSATALTAGHKTIDGNLTVTGSIFTQIIYDSNNTGYFLDPNGSSRLNNIVIDAETCYGWIDFPNVTGLRSAGINNAHFHPNDGSYGAWRVKGTRGTWGGLEFDSTGAGNISLMMNSGRTGVHNNTYGWQWYWENGDFYISKSTFGGNATLVKVLTSATDGNSKGSVKAFCSFNGQSTSPTSIPTPNSYNIDRVQRLSTGQFLIYFTNRPPHRDYVATALGTRNANIGAAGNSTEWVFIEFRNESGTVMNPTLCHVAVFW